jgi:hypothetical protein
MRSRSDTACSDARQTQGFTTEAVGQRLSITKPFSLLALAAFTASAIYASLANAAPADIAACDRLAAQAETTFGGQLV